MFRSGDSELKNLRTIRYKIFAWWLNCSLERFWTRARREFDCWSDFWPAGWDSPGCSSDRVSSASNGSCRSCLPTLGQLFAERAGQLDGSRTAVVQHRIVETNLLLWIRICHRTAYRCSLAPDHCGKQRRASASARLSALAEQSRSFGCLTSHSSGPFPHCLDPYRNPRTRACSCGFRVVFPKFLSFVERLVVDKMSVW